MKLLIIDDSEDITDVVNLYCDSSGIECTTVNDGNSGIQAMREQEFDLILLDIAMPEFTGIDVIDSLANEGLLQTNNVVIFTASSDPKLKEAIERRGVKEILKKPISMEELDSFFQKYRPATSS